jgi:putative heme transporter
LGYATAVNIGLQLRGRPSRFTSRFVRPVAVVEPDTAAVAVESDAARPTTATSGSRDADAAVRYGLRVSAGYAWRIIVVLGLVYLIALALHRVQFVVISVFVGLVITALLRPFTNVCAKVLPRSLAVALSLLVAIVVVLGGLAFVADTIVSQSSSLTSQFNRGLTHTQKLLQGKPFHVHNVDLSKFTTQAESWISQHQGTVVHQIISGAGLAAELSSGLALALFCAVCFLYSGDRMWQWFLTQVPVDRDRWDAAGHAAWTTFAGYTRGVVIISATNAVLVGITLLLLGVPLAVPLALLVFFAAFVPLIGSAAALAVATVVALATRGPWIAVAVLGLIVVIGEIEGHLLHPFVMTRAVKLHAVVVVLTVTIGGLVDGIIGAAIAVPVVSVVWSVVTTLRGLPGGLMPTCPEPDTGQVSADRPTATAE